MADDKFEPMDEEALNALLDDKRANAELYDASESDETKGRRAWALKYFEGEVDLLEPSGRSKFVDRTMSDAVGMIMPALAGIFLGSDDIVKYSPVNKRHTQFAKDATRYINHVIMNECDGYNNIYAALLDGEMLGNGLFKFWWDHSPVEKTVSYSELTDAEFGVITAEPADEFDDLVEVIEQYSYEGPPTVDPQTGIPMPTMLYDVKLKVTERMGRLRFMAMPLGEFRLARDTKVLDEDGCSYASHVYKATRSDLVEQGFNRDDVLDIPMDSGEDYRSAEDEYARGNSQSFYIDGSNDPSMEPIEVEEAYVKVDYDGDGIAEWRKVVRGASQGSQKGGKPNRVLLVNEEWGDPLPFADIKSDPIPHRWRGRSVYDLTKDIQDVQTYLKRGVIDSLAFTIMPRNEVVIDQVRNPDSLIDPVPGEAIHVDRSGTITPLVQPFVGKEAFPVIEHFDALTEKRTGVSRATAGTDLDTLQDQTATATNAAMSASHAKVALKARNIQQGGMKRLFECLLKLVVKHQRKPREIELAEDDWVTMDPRTWDPNMRATVNIGLGTGSREKDLMLLMQIIQDQDKIAMTLGPDNPVCSLVEMVNTRQKAVESGGMRNPDQFYKTVTEKDAQAWIAKKAQAAANAPNPEMQKVQAQMMAKQAELQQKAQSDAIEAQQREQEIVMKAQREREADQRKHMAEMDKQAREFAISVSEMKAKHRIALAEQESEMRLRIREQNMEYALGQREVEMRAKNADTNIDRQ